VVVLAALDFGNKIWCCLNVGNDRVFESANACFIGAPAVKENNIITSFGNELIDLGWLEVHATTDNAIFVNLDFVGNTECHDLVTHAYFDARKIIANSIRPLKVNGLESRKLFGDPHVFFDGSQRSTDGSIDAVFRDDDSAVEIEAFTKCALPQANCFWVGKRCELVEEDDFGGFDDSKFSGVAINKAWLTSASA
jgi:hypothetical protein